MLPLRRLYSMKCSQFRSIRGRRRVVVTPGRSDGLAFHSLTLENLGFGMWIGAQPAWSGAAADETLDEATRH
jgi:hypothetical protein